VRQVQQQELGKRNIKRVLLYHKYLQINNLYDIYDTVNDSKPHIDNQ
jgi:hypothetical protein